VAIFLAELDAATAMPGAGRRRRERSATPSPGWTWFPGLLAWDIITTGSLSNPDITEEEIDQYMEAVRDAVAEAVENQQSFFEKLWSWLNEDDMIGTQVFFWKHDDLAARAIINLSQRWEDEGDWELFGHINATVVCTAEAAEILDAIFSRASRKMPSFRDREVGGTRLQHGSRWPNGTAPSSGTRSATTLTRAIDGCAHAGGARTPR
jgi:hypothetical protein